jgi:hypothetical protein
MNTEFVVTGRIGGLVGRCGASMEWMKDREIR